jgi:23S rRNA (cytidine1920-2'-O)/16S rRNA (cytidine1409-2'-O)-methyltransferase
MAKKCRVSERLKEDFPDKSERVITGLILAGKVIVGNEKITTPGTMVSKDSPIRILGEEQRYVSRGGLKLEGALKSFGLDIADKVVLDVGISTGGFTDCTLQHGAKAVIGLDVGYGQVANILQNDTRVAIMERTNARIVTADEVSAFLNKKYAAFKWGLADVGLVVMDLSFISVRSVLPNIKSLLGTNVDYIILIKPQFEARKDKIGQGGIVRDDATRNEIVETLLKDLQALGFNCGARIESPITGTKGNIEFLLHIK